MCLYLIVINYSISLSWNIITEMLQYDTSESYLGYHRLCPLPTVGIACEICVWITFGKAILLQSRIATGNCMQYTNYVV